MWTNEKQHRAEVGGALVSLRGNLEAMLNHARGLSKQLSPGDSLPPKDVSAEDLALLGEEYRQISLSFESLEGTVKLNG